MSAGRRPTHPAFEVVGAPTGAQIDEVHLLDDNFFIIVYLIYFPYER